LKAQFPFVPDPEKKIVELYDVKMAVVGFASRTTFVVGTDGKIVSVQSGSDALDPSSAITSCPLHRPPATPAAPAAK
jgi:peroxiredoxin Q/BCP